MPIPLKKNIWSIYYLFLLLGLVYLVAISMARWTEVKDDATIELNYLNRIFASSVELNFDQQEIMLELLGQQILAGPGFADIPETRLLLDNVLNQNDSLIAFGLSDLDGNIRVGSSNLNLERMPNLKKLENSRVTFQKAIELRRMVLGRTYFLPALDDLVIPIRKGIRNDQDQLIGMMTGGIKPTELLPRLSAIKENVSRQLPYQLRVYHDQEYYYAYVSGISDKSQLRQLIDTPIPKDNLQTHSSAIRDQLGISFSELTERTDSVLYTAADENGEMNLYSLLYLPKYQLWTNAILPRNYLLVQLWKSILLYVITYLILFGFSFLLFRRIDNFERSSRDQLAGTIGQLRQEMQEREKVSIELESKNAELERFAYTVSHDLKTPLVTIKGFLGHLGRDIEESNRQKATQDMERITVAADTMGMLLEGLLEHSRIGHVAGKPENCDLTSIARNALDLVRSLADDTNAEVLIEDMPSVHGDRLRLIEVYQNLIENALKFSNENSPPRIQIGATEHDGMVHCHVRDNGSGIEADYQDQVFELFERLDVDAEGTGVGLALVKRIIEAQGGKIRVESDGSGRGCTFKFTLPVAVAGDSS